MSNRNFTLGTVASGAPILLTGAAGFIGFHTARAYLDAGLEVVGFDNVNEYYDPGLKHARLDILASYPKFTFVRGDLADQAAVEAVFQTYKPNLVINLAAQAGVRYSVDNPRAYISSNIDGFLNILEACRHFGVNHLVYASSSSVYGMNAKVPFSEEDGVDHPVSLYAVTKRTNELLAHNYAHQFKLPVTGLRFFTVYGPFGRPDMAYFAFTKNILEGTPITVYRDGTLERDFTYVDDIVEALTRIGEVPAEPDTDFDPATNGTPSTSNAPYRVYNIGNHRSETVNALIGAIERVTNIKAVRIEKPMPMGDVEKTYAQVDKLIREVDFSPATKLEDGIAQFVHWYRRHYGK